MTALTPLQAELADAERAHRAAEGALFALRDAVAHARSAQVALRDTPLPHREARMSVELTVLLLTAEVDALRGVVRDRGNHATAIWAQMIPEERD